MTPSRLMRAFGAFVLCAALSIGFLFLAGCTKQERTSHHSASRPGHMSVYHSPNASGEWLYWYLLMNHNGSTYYYSSPTVLTGGYSNVPFTRAEANAMPAEVVAAQSTAAIAQEEVPVAEEPAAASAEELAAEVAADQAADIADMHADEGAEAADVSPSSEGSTESGSSDSGSSDSGSSGGDSGGGGSSD